MLTKMSSRMPLFKEVPQNQANTMLHDVGALLSNCSNYGLRSSFRDILNTELTNSLLKILSQYGKTLARGSDFFH